MELAVLAALALVAIGTVATGTIVRHHTGGLGTKAPPFVMAWSPKVDALAAVGVLVALAATWGVPRLAAWRVRALPWSLGLYVAGLVCGLAVNAARGGTGSWWRIFDVGPGGSGEAANEYLPGLPTLRYGVRFYLDRYAELVPTQSVNVAGHPPGPLLLLRVLGIDGAQGHAALCIVLAATAAPLTSLTARALLDEAAARRAGILAAASPVVLLFAFTSYDGVFMALGALAAWALVAARGPLRVALAAAALALAAFFSWALLGVGAWAALTLWARDGWRRGLVVAAACGVALLASLVVLAGVWGYDPIGTLRATEGVYRNSLAAIRPYWFWLFGSPVAWGLMLGAPLAGAAAVGAVRRQPAALAIAGVLVIASVAGFTKAETERIWLIFVPLACVAAAGVLPARWLRAVVALGFAQALVVQVLFNTVW